MDRWIASEPLLHAVVVAGIDRERWYVLPRPVYLLEAIDREKGKGDRKLVAEAGRYLARRGASRTDPALEVRTPEILFSLVPEVWTRYFDQGHVVVAKLGRGYGRLVVEGMDDPSLALNAMIAGYLDEALRIAGAREVDVRVARAAALGDDKDIYEATWSS